jgi:hypothetical protein
MRVSLGSDWLSNDRFKVMRSAMILPRAVFRDVSIRNARDVLRMATIDGAKCLRLDKEIGSLEAGKKADVILVDMRTAWCNPLRTQNLITNLVYNANGSDVTHVFVDGEHLVDGGKLLRFDETGDRRVPFGGRKVWGASQHLFAAEGMARWSRHLFGSIRPSACRSSIWRGWDMQRPGMIWRSALWARLSMRLAAPSASATSSITGGAGLIDRAFAMSAAFHAAAGGEAADQDQWPIAAIWHGLADRLSIEGGPAQSQQSFMLMHEIAPEDEAIPDGPINGRRGRRDSGGRRGL